MVPDISSCSPQHRQNCCRRLVAAGRGAVARRLTAMAILPALICTLATAQCQLQWEPGASNGGLFDVSTLTVLPNGDLVAGGAFASDGVTTLNHIARWNGRQWTALGSGTNGTVQALAALPNGDLIAGGAFLQAGGVAVNGVARWNGTAWSAMGSGMNSAGISALAVLPGGDIVAGGSFATAGGVSAGNIARWTGSAWTAMGSYWSGPTAEVRSLTVLSSGDLVAAGRIHTASGPVPGVAQWNGTGWVALGSNAMEPVLAGPNGSLIAAGSFPTAGGTADVASWNGSTWVPLGSGTGMRQTITALGWLPGGEVVAGSANWMCFSRWNGAAWSPMVTLSDAASGAPVALATMPSGDLIAAFTCWQCSAGMRGANPARWRNGYWMPLGDLPNDSVEAFAALPDGDVVAGGSFPRAGGTAANGIAVRHGTSWLPVGSGLGNTPGLGVRVGALGVLPNGDIVAGGTFTTAGGVPALNVARWNGSAWQPMGGGLWLGCNVLLVRRDGRLLAGGPDGLFEWTGSTWVRRLLVQQFSFSVRNQGVKCLVELPDGDLVFGGHFEVVGSLPMNNIGRWNGSSATAVGPGLSDPAAGAQGSEVTSLAVLPNGDLVAGGEFTSAGTAGVGSPALWNGSSWSAMNAPVSGRTMVAMPGGGLFAAGAYNGYGQEVWGWDGSTWTRPAVPGLGGGFSSAFGVAAMCGTAQGKLVVSGFFATAGGGISEVVAVLATPCPASATPVATTCNGLTGPVTLTAETLPWIGGTFRSTASGFGANAIVLSLIGVSSPATPLTAFTPAALSGCSLLASPDSITFHLPIAGAASWQVAIPRTLSLLATPLYHQFLQLENAQAPGAPALSSSNALSLLLGRF